VRIIAAILALMFVPARAAAVDWKMYGAFSIEGGSVCLILTDPV